MCNRKMTKDCAEKECIGFKGDYLYHFLRIYLGTTLNVFISDICTKSKCADVTHFLIGLSTHRRTGIPAMLYMEMG